MDTPPQSKSAKKSLKFTRMWIFDVVKGLRKSRCQYSSGPVTTCYMGRSCTEIVGFASLFDFCSIGVLSLHQTSTASCL